MTVILSVTKTDTNNNKIKMKFIDYSLKNRIPKIGILKNSCS